MAATATESGGPHVVLCPALEEALNDAEERTLAELGAVRELLRRAVGAATGGDATIADQVIAQADQLDRRHGDVHDAVVAVIARQAPVAGDLRLAIALLHVNDRTERMGTQCMNVATLCRAMPAGAHPSADQLECLGEMARLADEQVAEAAAIFAERDATGVRRLSEHDAAINELNRRCFEMAVRGGGDEKRREIAFLVAMMARAIERFGDSAVDIGQQAAFAVTGRLRPGR